VGDPKVFGLGFQKTGTSSLEAMLRRLGYDEILSYHQFRDMAQTEGLTLEDIKARAMDLVQTCDAAKDTPWPLFYRELDAAFPGAKFIHVIRNRDAWIKSAVGDFAHWPNMIHQAIYGTPCPQGYEEIWLERYDRHNAEVAAYFEGRPDDYLQLNLEEGLTYDRICPFLGKPVLQEAIPQANTRGEARLRRLKSRLGLGG